MTARVELPDDVAARILAEVIRPVMNLGGMGPHHAPVWGDECPRCPKPTCSACRGGYHSVCHGRSFAYYAESAIYGPGPHAERLDDWPDWVSGPWQLWIAPPVCACGCPPRVAAPRPEYDDEDDAEQPGDADTFGDEDQADDTEQLRGAPKSEQQGLF